jgi:hypothetical protein
MTTGVPEGFEYVIFSLFSRVAVKLGDETHIFDRARLMYSEVAEIEKVTGLSYGEWERELARYSITAVAALLHILRKRDGKASDFASMQFNAADLDVVPLKDDDTEMTPADIAADLARRQAEAELAANPTPGADEVPPAVPPVPDTTATSLSSPSITTSARGNGTSSHGATSSSSALTPTGS